MPADPVPEATREPPDRALEAGVVERSQRPAALAEHVVVMLTAGHGRLVAGAAGAHLYALHEARAVQAVERSVDGRRSDALPVGAQALGDVLRAQAAALSGEMLDDCAARGAAARPLAVQSGERSLGPFLLRGHTHSIANR